MKFLDAQSEHTWNCMGEDERSSLLISGRVHPYTMDAIILNTEWGVACLTGEEIIEAGSAEAALQKKTAHLKPFYGKSVADIMRDASVKVYGPTDIHTVKAEPTPATKAADENRRREHKYLTENMLKKALMEAFKGEPKYFPKVNIQTGGRQAGKTFDRAMRDYVLRDASKKIDEETGVWIDDAPPPFTKDEWTKLVPTVEKVLVGGQGWSHYYLGSDGKLYCDGVDMTARTVGYGDAPFPAVEPATPPATPAKTLHHNRGFFPNKVGRIDVLPRYPGVWG